MNRDRNRLLEVALRRGLDYVLERQRPDGSWVDWNLPPAQSSIWTTAFVGGKLQRLNAALKLRAAAATAAAAQWLCARVFPDAGWGYNELVASDADTTALAILFLVSAGKTIPLACYARLESFQCADGGFATYRGSPELGSWGVSHMDVTATALLALLTQRNAEDEMVTRGLRFVLNSGNAHGIWDAFWWTSGLYSTQASLTLLKNVGLNIGLPGTRETLMQLEPTNPFERALLLSSLLFFPCARERAILDLVDQLLETQEPDGSWPSSPMLRVTRRDCFEPWKPGDADRLYCDQNRLFTTATVLEALSAFQPAESAAAHETGDHLAARP
jgi:squalene cyclase